MKVILVEDEVLAMQKLERYILKYDATIDICARLTSISETVSWIKNSKNVYDLVFMDIQLTDGLSFEIFNQVQLQKPVIFTTAFDEYAIDAFKVNSIDYILKPITFTDISKALTKHKVLRGPIIQNQIEDISNLIQKKTYKDRFLVKLGNHIHAIKTQNIALFYAEGRTVFLVTNEGKKYILDYKLEDLTKLLNTADFYRVSRTYIVNIDAIKDVIMYSNSRLKLLLNITTENDIIVSRDRASTFKTWFGGN